MMRTKRTWNWALALALLGPACGEDEPAVGTSPEVGETTSTGIVAGRLDSDEGYQHASRALPGADKAAAGVDAVSVRAILRSGTAVMVRHGTIASDRSFRIEDVPAFDEPFTVEVSDEQGSLVAVALVPGPLVEGEHLTTLPISRETTVEAQTWGTIGAWQSSVDPIAVANSITAQMAASTDEPWGPAVEASLDAWRAAMGALGATGTSATETLQIRATPFAELARALDAATTPEEADAAWAAYRDAEIAAITEWTGVDVAGQAIAAEAASFALLSQASRGGLSQVALDHARAAAMVGSAQVHMRQQLQAAAQVDASGTLGRDIAAGYDSFFQAVENARTPEALRLATRDLGLALKAAAERAHIEGGGPPGGLAQVAGAAQTALEASLASAQSPEAIGKAYVSFATVIQEASVDVAGGPAPTEAASLAASLTTHQHLLGSLDVALSVPSNPDGAVTGVVHVDAPAGGAQGLVAGLDPLVSTAASAFIGAVREDGTLDLLGVGTADPRSGLWDVVVAPGSSADLVMVKLMGGGGGIVGAAIVPGGISDGTFVAPLVTEATTARALVTLELLARGESPEGIDQVLLATLIADGTARAVLAEGAIPAAAGAFDLAGRVAALAGGMDHGAAMAVLGANAAFEAAMGGRAVGSVAQGSIDAEAQLRAGAVAADTVRLIVVSDAVIDEALDALIAATATATSRHEIAAAGVRFSTTLRHTVIAERLAGTDIALTPLVAEAMPEVVQARDTLATSIGAMVRSSRSPDEIASDIVAAFAVHQARVHEALAGAVAAEPELGAIEDALIILGAGLFGQAL